MDWEALARAGAPIVLYMAVSNLAAIAQALMRGGLSGATPTLVVHGATTPRETLLEAPLAQLPALAERGAIASPRDRRDWRHRGVPPGESPGTSRPSARRSANDPAAGASSSPRPARAAARPR